MQTRPPQGVSMGVDSRPLSPPPEASNLSQLTSVSGQEPPREDSPHRPMVTSDQPFLLRPSFHLLFLHFTSRPINCISPSSDNSFFFGLGVTGGRCVPVILERIWSIVTPGLVCNAARRMTFRKSLDQCSARPATGRCGQDFGRTIRILDCEGNQVTRQSGISSIGLPIISYSKGIPLADFASTTLSPPFPHYC
jgi:hypothetical protein